MNRFLKLSGEEKREVFQAVSLSMGLRPDIVEKDFWVCFMLHHLFHDCKYKDAFVFNDLRYLCTCIREKKRPAGNPQAPF